MLMQMLYDDIAQVNIWHVQPNKDPDGSYLF